MNKITYSYKEFMRRKVISLFLSIALSLSLLTAIPVFAAGPVNLALSATATANSEYLGYGASGAQELLAGGDWATYGGQVGKNTTSAVSAPTIDGKVTFTYTWSTPVNIGSIKLANRGTGENIKRAKLYVNDVDTGMDIFKLSNNANLPTVISLGQVRTDVTKLQLVVLEGNGNFGLAGFEVYEVLSGNNAFLATVSQSTQYPGTEYLAANVRTIGLGQGTAGAEFYQLWASNGEPLPWIQYNFASVITVGRVRLQGRPGEYITKARLVVNGDRLNAYTITGINGTEAIDFGLIKLKTNVTSLRLEALESIGGSNVGLAGFEVYSDWVSSGPSSLIWTGDDVDVSSLSNVTNTTITEYSSLQVKSDKTGIGYVNIGSNNGTWQPSNSVNYNETGYVKFLIKATQNVTIEYYGNSGGYYSNQKQVDVTDKWQEVIVKISDISPWAYDETNYNYLGIDTLTFRDYGGSKLAANQTLYISPIEIWTGDIAASNTQTTMNFTKDIDGFVVNIVNWVPTNKYQIWTYQEIKSSIFESATEELTYQWVLSMPYTQGIDRGTNGFVQNLDGSISKNIGNSFTSSKDTYTVCVKISDSNGKYISQIKQTYTPESASIVKINKILVDGQFASSESEIKKIDTNATITFDVFGNNVANTSYAAVVTSGTIAPIILTASGTNLDKFVWDIDGIYGLSDAVLAPGKYTATLTATNGSSSDVRTINLELYKVDNTIQYGDMTSMNIIGSVDTSDSSKYNVQMDNIIASGAKFFYQFAEPMRAPIFVSAITDAITGVSNTITDNNLSASQFGNYEVRAFVKRSVEGTVDDGIYRNFTIQRPGTHSISLTAGGTLVESSEISWTKNNSLAFIATATLQGVQENQIQYSYWRRDANGWILIRDYNTSGNLNWTPCRVGQYTIQVRAKGTDAGSYELIKTVEINVTDSVDKIAVVSGITLNETDINTNASARAPIVIKADATADSEDLLYKYIIYNSNIFYIETKFSPDPNYTWIPAKGGDYTIAVLVKNKASFGKYDDVKTFVVNVNP